MRGWVVAVAMMAAVACSRGKCEPCAKDADCGAGLSCDAVVNVCKPPESHLTRKSQRGWSAACPVDCKASGGCESVGACEWIGDRCAPTSDAHCAASWACERLGDCVERRGFCAPSK